MPNVCQPPHHIEDTQQFVDHTKSVHLLPEKVMTSYDITVLFTSVPVHPAINIVQTRLQQDPLLQQRTSMSILQIITLIEVFLKNTYFLFQGKYFEQVHDVAKEFHIILCHPTGITLSPVSPAPQLPRPLYPIYC